MTKRCMSGQQMTKSQYAIQKNVELLGNLILQVGDQRLTDISTGVAHFAHCNGIGYLVHRYLSTRLLPFEEFCDEWFHQGDIQSLD